jgi:hypothetical protein
MKDIDQFAREWDKRIAEGTEATGLRRIQANVSKEPRSVVPIRMSQQEHAKITDAVARLQAQGQKTNVSEFIRSAALRAAENDDRNMRIVLTYNQHDLDSEQLTNLLEAALEDLVTAGKVAVSDIVDEPV